MKAAAIAFGSEFGELPIAAGGQGVPQIRGFDTPPESFLGPIAFFGMLMGDGVEEWVELIDFVDDFDYYDTIGDDPTD